MVAEERENWFLKELFVHFDAINSSNIGKGYRDKFRDPDQFFGSSNVFFNGNEETDDIKEVSNMETLWRAI